MFKSYQTRAGEIPVLLGVDLEVHPGEAVAIMGRSGCGKTTLLYVIAGISRADAGKVMIDNLDIQRLSESGRDRYRAEKIGYVFQTFNLLSRQTALSNVILPLMYSKEKDRKSKSQAALEKVGLGDRIHHKPTQLSGGQQQRVAIARALVNNPHILLADEPTGNLDSTATDEILSIFRDLNENEGITVIMVTHEHEIAAQAQRTIAMKDGLITSDEKTPAIKLSGIS